jgi:hypothetical protein
VDKERDIGRIGISVTDKAFARSGFIDRGLKRPALCRRIAEGLNRLNLNAGAPIPTRQAREPRVGNVPAAVQEKEVAVCNGKLKLFSKVS